MSNSELSASLDLSRRLEQIQKLLCDVYLSDNRPWVVGFSGGKDSTATVQLVWYALQSLPRDRLTKPLFIIAGDTLVETPAIMERIETSLQLMNETATRAGLPFQAHKVVPRLSESFWVNLIGRGYPAPSAKFRWCTDRMKIQPANRFILDRVAEYGEVILVLGVRKAESATRAQLMNLRKIHGTPLSRHTTLPNAYVLSPIEDFSTDDVWSYLLQVPNPWGADNHELLSLYRNAQSGECPLVIDSSTPSCGNSRFGCWVCTVVTRDKALEALVDNGEEWLEPLLEFRDKLAATQDPEQKHLYREERRRNGRIQLTSDGRVIYGPYKLEFCKQLLRDLLRIQRSYDERGIRTKVISEAEIHEIRRIWRTERQDWEDAVPEIYREVMGYDLNWVLDDGTVFGATDSQLLEEICQSEGVPKSLVQKLIDVERELSGLRRRSRIFDRIDSVFEEEWRTADQVKASLEDELE